MNKTFTVSEALEKMRHYCAYQERCHKDVKDKLYSMRMIPQVIEQVMGTLVNEGYLNESRFAQQFAHGKFSIKHWGKLRITRELKFRKVSAYDIKLALKKIDDATYLKKINEISEKKWEQLSRHSTQIRKQKLFQYLAYRGWETHLIYEQLDRLTAS